jgi:hypothetical protein
LPVLVEGLHPEPNLFGRDLREQAEVERWNRRMELELFAPVARTVQNTSPIFQGRFKQFPEYGEEQGAIVYRRLERMDRELSEQQPRKTHSGPRGSKVPLHECQKTPK